MPFGMTTMSSKSHTGYRDSRTGQFVTERTAERRPATTQKESIPNPGRGDTGRSKGRK
jgi:hypothetical protein